MCVYGKSYYTGATEILCLMKEMLIEQSLN